MSFVFALDNFSIANTRSAHKDTDYAVLTVKAGNAAPQTAVKAMGDVNNGTHPVGLQISTDVNPGDPVTINYIILNCGGSSSSVVEGILQDIGSKLAVYAEAVSAQRGFDVIQGLYAAELKAIDSSKCDGAVAVLQNNYDYADLMNNTEARPYFTQTTQHIGPQGPEGCLKGNSNYSVTWHMAQTATVPPVTQRTYTEALAQLQGVGLGAQHEGPGEWVVSQKNPPGSAVPVGTQVVLTTMVQS